MNEIPLERRLEPTEAKLIKLTPRGRQAIQVWAEANRLNFSAAIETLALIGLQDERSLYIMPALQEAARQAMRLAFNRLARLLSDIAIEAAAGRTVAEGVLLQLIRETAAAAPDDFEAVMTIQRDGQREPDARIRRFHQQIKASAEAMAIRRLRQSQSRIEEILDDSETDEGGEP